MSHDLGYRLAVLLRLAKTDAANAPKSARQAIFNDLMGLEILKDEDQSMYANHGPNRPLLRNKLRAELRQAIKKYCGVDDV